MLHLPMDHLEATIEYLAHDKIMLEIARFCDCAMRTRLDRKHYKGVVGFIHPFFPSLLLTTEIILRVKSNNSSCINMIPWLLPPHWVHSEYLHISSFVSPFL